MGDSTTEVEAPKQSKFEKKLFKIAKKYWGETKPIRGGFYDIFEQLREGTFDPTEHPSFEPAYRVGREGLESQHGVARNAIMSQMPRGGQLNEQLANLEMQRAQSIGGLEAQMAQQITNDMMQKAYGVGFQAPQTSIAGLSSAAGPYASRYGANIYSQLQAQGMQNQLFGGLGTGIGQLGGQLIGSGAFSGIGGDKGVGTAGMANSAIATPNEFMFAAPY